MSTNQTQINVVGSSTFGVWPKISIERTVNMYISDEWLISYPGYKKIVEIDPLAEGRALFHSIRGNFLIFVSGGNVYRLNGDLGYKFLYRLKSVEGEVFIDENLSSQICLVDGIKAYIYNYSTGSFTEQSLDFTPGYVCYINSFFLLAPVSTDINPQQWYVYQQDTSSTIARVSVGGTFELQTKPDKALAIRRLPGRGNNVLVLGSSVAEVWSQVGGNENFRRNSSFNIDYGLVNKSTIAANDTMVVWLSRNENNSPVIMVTDGSSKKTISTDGINYQLEKIQYPEDSTAFIFKQNGHVFYQLTFYNEADNLTLAYDFTTDKFFHITDQNSNYHPARQVTYFNKQIYFASLAEGSMYAFDSNIIDAIEVVGATVGEEIPRERICNTIRIPNTQAFRIRAVDLLIEQGVTAFPSGYESETCYGIMITEDGLTMITEDDEEMLVENGFCSTNGERPRVDMSFSKNGNESFSPIVGYYLNAEGVYRNRLSWYRLGRANEMTLRFQFWGLQRFVCNNAVMEIAQ